MNDLEYPKYDVIVVDNGSTDGSGSRLEREFDWCEIILNEDNKGFAGGCNAGIRRALANDTDYVLVLNNDARIEQGFLHEIVSVAEDGPARIVGALIEDGDGEEVNGSPCRFPDLLYYSGYRESLPGFPSASTERRGNWWMTDRVEGAGVLFSRQLLLDRKDSVGRFLDDSLFMYCEEVELAMWCREHEESMLITEDAIVRHDGGASSTRAFQLYYLTRNRILVAHDYLEGRNRVLFDITYLVWKLAFAGKYAVTGRYGIMKAILVGLCDGFNHASGKGRYG